MLNLLKRFVSRLPIGVQQELKRLRLASQLKRGAFVTDEPEYGRLREWVSEGDWVLDVGANVGHYTVRLSELVGTSGRVLAFEPVPRTFELLAANVAALPRGNVTLINVAASDRIEEPSMTMPPFDTGLANYYQAYVTALDEQPEGEAFSVMSVPVDHLQIPKPVSLAKIDVEGHELHALRGMRALLERDHPVLIVEGRSDPVRDFLEALGYRFQEDPGSPNRVFTASA